MTDYRQTVREILVKGCEYDSRVLSNCYGDTVEDNFLEAVDRCYFATVGDYELLVLLQTLEEVTKDNKALSDAFYTVRDFIEWAHYEKDNAYKVLADKERQTMTENRASIDKVVEDYWQTLSESAKVALDVKENIKDSKQLAEMLYPDYDMNSAEICTDIVKDLVEWELLYDEKDKESLYI